jgi:hypothetical protein
MLQLGYGLWWVALLEGALRKFNTLHVWKEAHACTWMSPVAPPYRVSR